MKKKLLEKIIKNKEAKIEFAIITNLENGESCIFEKNKPIDKMLIYNMLFTASWDKMIRCVDLE